MAESDGHKTKARFYIDADELILPQACFDFINFVINAAQKHFEKYTEPKLATSPASPGVPLDLRSKIPTDRKKSGPNKAQSKPWDDTLLKLEKLRDIRKESKQKGQIIKWTLACNQAGIEPRIARKHDPELRTQWYDKEF
jgi:hypothetical protein